MQFRLLPALVLFIGSYFPLALILLVQDVQSVRWGQRLCIGLSRNDGCTYQILVHPWSALSIAFITLCALAGTLYTFGKVPLRFNIEVIEVKSVPNDLINYVFPYVVSFMGLDYSEPDKLADRNKGTEGINSWTVPAKKKPKKGVRDNFGAATGVVKLSLTPFRRQSRAISL